MDSEKESTPEAQADSASASGWRALATDAAGELEARLRRYAHLTDRERVRLARRFEAVVERALEVPPDLSARVHRSVVRMRKRSPGADPVALAWMRTRSRARRTATIGAVTAVPAMIPAIGPALAALGLVVDWRYVAEQQRDLVLEIAELMGVKLDDPTRSVRTLFLASAASAFGATAAGEAVANVLARQIARRSVTRVVPGAGAVVAGALNYVATIALGRAALARFADEAGIGVEGIVPQQVHAAMPWLRNAVVHAFEPKQGITRRTPVFTEQDLVTILELPLSNREELLDLAVAADASAAGDDGPPIVDEVALALGFTPDELALAQRAAARDTATASKRLRRLLDRAGSAGTRASRRLWKRAATIARGRSLGRPRRAIEEPPPDDS